MHTVQLLSQTLEVAESLGYGVRHEWLGGGMGGACEIAGRRWLFVDLALNPVEQLDQVVRALKRDPGVHTLPLPAHLRQLFDLPRAA